MVKSSMKIAFLLMQQHQRLILYVEGGSNVQVRMKPDGNDIVVCLPQELLDEAALKPNDILCAEVVGSKLIIRKIIPYKNVVPITTEDVT